METRQRDEIKLVRHLASVLKASLTGRRHPYVLARRPDETVLAGVLFPAAEFEKERSEQETAPLEHNTDDHEQAGTAAGKAKAFQALHRPCNLGLEMRIAPPTGCKKVQLRVEPRIALYVRVFPTREEQMAAGLVGSGEEAESEALTDEAEEAVQGEAVTPTDDPAPAPVERYDLVRKYRRVDVASQPVTIEIDLAQADGEVQEYRGEIRAALEAKRQEMLTLMRAELFALKSPQSMGQQGRGHRRQESSVEGPWPDEQAFREALDKVRGAEARLPMWQAALHVTVSPDTNGEHGVSRLMVALVNETPQDPLADHPTELYDCGIAITVESGELLPFVFEGVRADYRYNNQFTGLGVNCVALHPAPNRLESETVPDYFQNWYRTTDLVEARFDALATDPSIVMAPILEEMKRYQVRWAQYLGAGAKADGLTTEEVRACDGDKVDFDEEVTSFELGLQVLQQDHRLLTAFKLMNAVFAEVGSRRSIEKWRLFQIVFIARLLPGLAARESNEPAFLNQLEKADILWFPTGGGKTEAYLGLIVCGLFYDRLRGKSRGTTAWLRFPLRMLSKQQMDRLARVLAVAERVRQTSAVIPDALKGEPFSMGYFVGGGNTPNFISRREMEIFTQDERIRRRKGLLLHRCPFCEQRVEAVADQETWRLLHVCRNTGCFAHQHLGGVLPIYVTDSEIYRYLPSVLCGTVDKLANLGLRGEFSHIFGQVQGRCPVHGYYSGGECIEKRLGSRSCTLGARQYESVKPIGDPTPALIIQDELHLLKEELGTFNGHYEGFLTEYARSIGNGKPPKVLAATATIEEYQHHSRHLYLREPNRYPVPGYQLGENFYATSRPAVERRLYLGLLSHLKAQEATIGRCMEIYQKEINRLYAGGMQSVSELDLQGVASEEEWRSLLGLYDLNVAYVNQKATASDLNTRIRQILTPMLLREGFHPLESVTLTGDDELEKVGEVIDRIEAEGGLPLSDKLLVLIATSLISHGVDLERINALFMAGMPSHVAEYIQASSRSARSHAGLVLVSFNGKDIRERSQFQYFRQNHAFLERLVDPVPIHRFAHFALLKTIPGLVLGLMQNLYARRPDVWKKYKYRFETTGEIAHVLRDPAGLVTEDMLREHLFRIIGVDSPWFPQSMRNEARSQIGEQVREVIEVITRAPAGTRIFELKEVRPLTSFRDVDAGVPFLSVGDSTLVESKIGT